MEIIIILLVVFFIILMVAYKEDEPELSSDFKMRIQNKTLDNKSEYKSVECKGVFPGIINDTNICFTTSIFDKTDDPKDLKPVLCNYRDLQESNTPCFQSKQEIGIIKPFHGFTDWTSVGIVPLQELQPPTSGKRDLVIITRMIDLENEPLIRNGWLDTDGPDSLYLEDFSLSHTYTEFGYEEMAKNKNEGRILSIKLGMAVAMSDGILDRSEGEKIKEWINDILSNQNKSLREELKELFNNAMKESHKEFKSGKISTHELTEALKEIADKSIKLEAMELCYSVMAADGIADSKEMDVLNAISSELDLSNEVINDIRDKSILNIDINNASQSNSDDLSNAEKVLGIDSRWSMEEKLKYLTDAFQKWSERINTFDDPAKREKAQEMINKISFIRNSYES